MERSKAHDPERLTRYAFGDLDGKERESLEGHLQSCASCQEFLSFVRDFNAELRDAKPQEPLPGEPCPDPGLIAALQEGEIDMETAEHVRAHILYCGNCREDFRTLEKLRPRIIDVVLRVAGSIIEVLRPPATVAWESPLAKVPVKGEIVPSAPFRVTQLITDEDKNKSRVTIHVETGIEPDHVRVLVEGASVLPQWKWRVSLLDGKEDEWTDMPFDKSRLVVASAIPFGLYRLEVSKGEDSLGAFKFTVENIDTDEALEKAHEYVEAADYFRPLAILKDALRRDSENERLLQELNRVEKLAAQEEAEEEGELESGHD